MAVTTAPFNKMISEGEDSHDTYDAVFFLQGTRHSNRAKRMSSNKLEDSDSMLLPKRRPVVRHLPRSRQNDDRDEAAAHLLDRLLQSLSYTARALPREHFLTSSDRGIPDEGRRNVWSPLEFCC
jgi:hypothetical protein